jgi:uncharacterized protein (TIGR01777 family)
VQSKCGLGVNIFTSLEQWKPQQVFDVVINLAGEPIADKNWSAQQKQVIWDSRVTLTQQLVNKIAATEEKPSLLLSGSAIGYYGNRNDQLLDESSGMGQDFSARLCSEWEAAALAAEALGVRVCLLRTGLVLSNKGGLLSKMLLPFGFGVRFGEGKNWMSWIHIDDYLDLLLLLMSSPNARGPYNMTSPNPVTNSDFAKTLVAIQHGPLTIPVPAALLKMGLGERATLLLEGQRVLPVKAEPLGFTFNYPELSVALAALI